MGSFLKLKNILEEKEKFLLICHEQPDGDALGSLLAFSEGLKNNGKEVIMVCKDSVPDIFSFLPKSSEIKNDFLVGSHESIILLDNGDLRRTGFSKRILVAKEKNVPIINIDHHPKNDLWKVASINYVNEDSSSSSELVFEILTGLKWDITSQMATLLLAGIFTDTGGFQHTNTSEKVLHIVSKLLSGGAKLKNISDNVSNSHSVARLKLWGIALNRMIVNKKLGIVSSFLLRNEIEKLQASDDEVSGLVNLMNSVPESKIALLLYETSDGNIRGSLRTENSGVDVSVLAKLCGGGGHKKAAGFTIKGKIEKVDNVWRVV